MYKPEVWSNRHLMERWHKEQYIKHRHRVCHPVSFFSKIVKRSKSLLKNSKRTFEYSSKINKENLEIIRGHNISLSSTRNEIIPINNRKHYKSEMRKISEENTRLLKRLYQQKSQY